MHSAASRDRQLSARHSAGTHVVEPGTPAFVPNAPTQRLTKAIPATPAMTDGAMHLFMDPPVSELLCEDAAAVEATVLLLTPPTYDIVESQERSGSSRRAAGAATP